MAGTIFDVATLGTANNSLTFNDTTSDPYFRVRTRYVTQREIDQLDIKLPEGTGDADFQTHIGKSYLLIRGTMYPNDETSANTGKQTLRKLASLEIQQNDADSDGGYVPYKFSANVDQQIFVKVVYVDMQETSRGIKQDFTLVCKMKYPVIFSQSSHSATLGNASATTSSGTGYSFLYPVQYGATVYSTSGAITNNGDLPTYPTITVTGPINRPKISNSTTGEYLEVAVNLLTNTDTLNINYDQDTTSITQAGSSVLNELTAGSTFFKIKPGTNNLSLSGSTVGNGANAIVSIQDAWPLS